MFIQKSDGARSIVLCGADVTLEIENPPFSLLVCASAALSCGVTVDIHFFFFVDMETGQVGNVRELGITESFLVKSSVIRSAAEAAEMILRVDDIIRSAPRRRDMDPRMGH